MKAERSTVYLSFGANIGESVATVKKAMKLIDRLAGTVLVKTSSFYNTKAWGNVNQPDFVNAVAEISTCLPAETLMKELLSIEQQLGRMRSERWGPRAIDIDILFYGNEIIESALLHVPHPELQNRKFVLQPLNEIAPGLVHPVLNKNMAQLLVECADETGILFSDNAISR